MRSISECVLGERFESQWLLCVPCVSTLNTAHFDDKLFMCFVRFLERTEAVSVNSIN
jgi:hypothetical protein